MRPKFGGIATSLFVVIATAFASLNAFAEGMGTKIGTVGDWTIYLDKDAMTDATTCAGVYRGRTDVQLSPNLFSLSLRGRGGVQGYRYRLDDGAPTEMQLPTNVEKEMDAVILEGDRFTPIVAAHRFRLEVITVLDTEVSEDIDLKSAPQVVALMLQHGCK